MKIGKNEAENIAKAVLAARLKELENKAKFIESKALHLALLHTPELILNAYRAHPSYVLDTKRVYFWTDSKKEESSMWSLTSRIPSKSAYGNPVLLTLPAEDFATFRALENEYDRLRDQYDKDLFDLKASILAFGTHAKLLKELPELAQYISNTSSTALALIPDADKVRKILSNS